MQHTNTGRAGISSITTDVLFNLLLKGCSFFETKRMLRVNHFGCKKRCCFSADKDTLKMKSATYFLSATSEPGKQNLFGCGCWKGDTNSPPRVAVGKTTCIRAARCWFWWLLNGLSDPFCSELGSTSCLDGGQSFDVPQGSYSGRRGPIFSPRTIIHWLFGICVKWDAWKLDGILYPLLLRSSSLI